MPFARALLIALTHVSAVARFDQPFVRTREAKPRVQRSGPRDGPLTTSTPLEPEGASASADSGADDFLLHVAVPDTDALYAVVIDRLTERPEVADVNTSVVYEHLRNHVIEPLG